MPGAKQRAALVGGQLGQYRIASLLGEGTQAKVYLAHDEVLGRALAVKVFKRQGEDLSAVIREARLTATLSHRNIIQVYAVDVSSQMPYMAMEYAPRSLEQVVERNGPMDISSALRFVRHAATALGHAHARGVVHRDIKPSNMLISESGALKLADFGLASRTSSKRDGLVGTPHYMAPEIWQGDGASAMSDVYSLGCCFYFMLTGKPPFVADSYAALKELHVQRVPEFSEKIPSEISDLVQWMMAKGPDARPQDFLPVIEQAWSLQSRGAVAAPRSDRPPAPAELSVAERVAQDVVRHPRFTPPADALRRALFDNTALLGLVGPAWRLQPFLLNQFLAQHTERAFVAARISVSGRGSLLGQLSDALGEAVSVRPAVYDEIATRLAAGLRPRMLSVVQVGIERSLSVEERSDVVELALRFRAKRVVLQVGCDQAMRDQLDGGFALAGLTNFPRWIEVQPLMLSEAWSLVEDWCGDLPNGMGCSPSAKLLLAASVRDEPEAAPRVIHNAIAYARYGGAPVITSFACRRGAAHNGFIESHAEVDPSLLSPPGQWPDQATHQEITRLRSELQAESRRSPNEW